MEVHGPIMNAGSYILFVKRMLHLIAARPEAFEIQDQCVQMPGMPGVGFFRVRQDNREISKSSIVASPNHLPAHEVALRTPQLMNPQCGLQVHHVVLEARFDDLVVLKSFVGEALPRVRTESVESEDLDALGNVGVGGGNHAALASHHVLRSVEAESADVAEGPSVLTANRCLDRVGAVLDY